MITFTVVLTLIITLVVIASVKGAQKRQRLNEEYQEFLKQHDGLEIFCYTNRLKSCGVIESELIPKLDKHVHIIKLIGKEPQTELDMKHISRALYSVKEIGFPSIMKIVNGRVIDLSLHKAIYDAINNQKVDVLPSLVNRKLEELRKMALYSD